MKNKFLIFSTLLAGVMLLLALFPKQTSAQCLQYPVELSERIGDAALIVEGSVLDVKTLRDASDERIYTFYLVEPSKLLKGNSSDHFWIEVPGGQLGMEIQRYSPEFKIQINEAGVYMVNPTATHLDGLLVYKSVAHAQGAIRYHAENGKALGEFDAYESPDALLKAVSENTGQPVRILRPMKDEVRVNFKDDTAQPLATPVISSLFPTSISAGTSSVLTIFGSGFGSSPSSAGKVGFANADNGGSTYIYAPSNHIVSWSDSRIDVRVPTEAGTGRVRVINSSNTTGTSNPIVTIPYAILNYSNTFMGVTTTAELYNQNGRGGISFTLNSSFAQNTFAKSALIRAVESWRCGSGANFDLSLSTTSANCSSNDGQNIVAFDNTCSLPRGVLASTYSRISGCFFGNTIFWQVIDIDMIFDADQNWNYGPGSTNSNRFDFESVALHELGHTHQLGHVISSNKVMNFSVGQNQDKRILDQQSDINGGLYVMQRSTSRSNCGTSAMVSVQTHQCRLNEQASSPPVANFVANITNGCSPLSVVFSDLSTGNPTSIEWDINNDGITDYLGSTISHTYTSSGLYSVRQTVRNASGSDTRLLFNYINVFRGGNLFVSPSSVITCANQAVTVQASGANSYQWAPNFNTVSNANTFTFSPSQSITLTVTATFWNGCQEVRTVPVTVRTAPVITTSTTDASSSQVSNGSVQIGASSGSPPFSYRLNTTGWQFNSFFTNLSVGTYTAYIRDGNGCESQKGFEIKSMAQSCDAPTNLTTSSISTGSVFLSWASISGASYYTVYYKSTSDNNWITTTAFSNSIQINNLRSGSNYQWYVVSTCTNFAQSSASSIQSFTTQTENQLPCTAPNVTVSEITNSSARLSWPNQSNATGWQIYFRSTSSSSWIIVWVYPPSSGTLLSGLTSNQEYQLYIRTLCGSVGISSFGGPYTFKTSNSNTSSICSAVTNVSIFPSTSSANVYWNGIPGASQYQISWRDVNSFNKISTVVPASNTFYGISNLVPGRNYEFDIVAVCGIQKSINSRYTFSTNSSSKISKGETSNNQSMRIYPNPSTGRGTIELISDLHEQVSELRISDLSGKLVWVRKLNEAELEGGNFQIVVEDFKSGMYIIEWKLGDYSIFSKWVIN